VRALFGQYGMQGVVPEKDQMRSFSILSAGCSHEDRIDAPRPTVKQWGCCAVGPLRGPARHSGQSSTAIRHNPPSGNRGNDELRTPCSIQLSVRRRHISIGQGRMGRPSPKLTSALQPVRRKPGMKYLIIREQVFGIIDDD